MSSFDNHGRMLHPTGNRFDAPLDYSSRIAGVGSLRSRTTCPSPRKCSSWPTLPNRSSLPNPSLENTSTGMCLPSTTFRYRFNEGNMLQSWDRAEVENRRCSMCSADSITQHQGESSLTGRRSRRAAASTNCGPNTLATSFSLSICCQR